jgi:putative ABC transport system permease protein
MILSIGWKNVWRNKVRSMIVVIAVMLGIFSGLMATGIMKGWIEQRIHSSIHNEVAHVQIHNPDFLLNEDMDKTIKNYSSITATLDTIPQVVAYSPRVKLFAMAQSDWSASGFMLIGVDPEKETKVSEIHKNLIEGNFLQGNHRLPSIVIGSKEAENLKLLNYQVTPEKMDSIHVLEISPGAIQGLQKIGDKRFRKEKDFKAALKKNLSKNDYKAEGDKLIKYFSFYRLGTSIKVTVQNKNGQVTNPVFKVRGIYKTNNSMFDGMTAFAVKDRLNEYTGLKPDEVQEIAIISTDNETGDKLSEKLARYFPDNNVMGWRKLSPEIAMYTDFTSIMGLIFVGIILFALAFGIINTMLMSVLERIKELGMLMAIGMNKKKVFLMIMTESVFLTLTGAIVGLVFSGIVIHITNITGINFNMWAEGFEAIGYAAIVYPTVSMADYIQIILLVIFTGVVAAIWPARKALKLNPVEALRTD